MISEPMHRRNRGFSLAEMVVTVAVIGILAAIAIPIYSNVHGASEKAVAGDHVEALNRAVTNFAQGCWKIPTAPDNSGTDDEFKVLRTLQYKFPVSAMKIGSPFFDPRYDPAASSSSSALRIRWNGKSFDLLDKGTSGSGLLYDGKGYKSTPYSFPSGFKPEGAN